MTAGRFSDATMAFIRASPTSAMLMAQAYGCSVGMIDAIRAGSLSAESPVSAPAMAGHGVSCCRCIHWSSGLEQCSIGFPDPLTARCFSGCRDERQ